MPQIGRLRKVRARSSISPHSRETWLLEMPSIPMARTRSSTEGRDALDIGVLDHGGQRLFGQTARLEEGREVAAAPRRSFGMRSSTGTRASLPVARSGRVPGDGVGGRSAATVAFLSRVVLRTQL
jgi:hypothetical protein